MFIFHENYYSASDLLNKSATQIVFFKNNRQAITERMNKCLVISNIYLIFVP